MLRPTQRTEEMDWEQLRLHVQLSTRSCHHSEVENQSRVAEHDVVVAEVAVVAGVELAVVVAAAVVLGDGAEVEVVAVVVAEVVVAAVVGAVAAGCGAFQNTVRSD